MELFVFLCGFTISYRICNMRILLAPLALLYFIVTSIRNILFRYKILKVYTPTIPTVLIGNLSTGGTGKTPHCAWVLDQFATTYNVATLSRGYKRKTNGYIKANEHSTATEIGDEPMEYVTQYPNVTVCVGENRVNAAQKIEKLQPPIDLLVLDDAYQHRAINGHLQILLTTFAAPYFKDHLLPWGNLRESIAGADRADFIIVTKCPTVLEEEVINEYLIKINPLPHQKVLFSTYQYAPITSLEHEHTLVINKKIVLITGIATNKNLVEHLESQFGSITVHSLPDHYDYSELAIKKLLKKFGSDYQIIITRKDAVKWLPYPKLWVNNNIGVIDIKVQFLSNPKPLTQAIQQIINHGSKA